MKKKRKFKITIMLVFSAFLIVFDLSFIISSLAKYVVNLPSSQKSTSVANWDVSVNLPSASVSLESLNVQGAYTLTVTNNSEVSSKYSIVVSNIPTGTIVALDNGAFKSGTGTVTFSNVGTISANATTKTKTHTIKFKAFPEETEVSNKNVKVEVVFEQTKPQ